MADAVYKALGMDGAADVWAAARQLRERCVAAATPYAAYEELDAPLAAMWAVALVFALAAAIALARRCRRQRRWPAKERRTARALHQEVHHDGQLAHGRQQGGQPSQVQGRAGRPRRVVRGSQSFGYLLRGREGVC